MSRITSSCILLKQLHHLKRYGLDPPVFWPTLRYYFVPRHNLSIFYISIPSESKTFLISHADNEMSLVHILYLVYVYLSNFSLPEAGSRDMQLRVLSGKTLQDLHRS